MRRQSALTVRRWQPNFGIVSFVSRSPAKICHTANIRIQEASEPSVKPDNSRAALAASLFGLFGAVALQAPALAHLGGDIDSVGADRDALRAELHTTPMQQYDLHEISTASGTVVHEYATRQGTVFAVTWQGPLPPDLRQLFGSYYDKYQSTAAARVRPGMHRQLNIAAGDLVVQSSGHLRAFRGRAYVPSLVPAGVSVVDLQ